MRLFRGPEQIFNGQPVPLAVEDGNIRFAIHATGEIKLPITFPPGDYALELSAWGRLEKNPAGRAAQWGDFTLVAPPSTGTER